MIQPAEQKLSAIGAILKKGTKGSVLLADLREIPHKEIDESVFQNLSHLTKLKELLLAGLPVTDQMLELIAGLKSLQSIDLTDTPVGNPSLDILIALPKLKLVQLSGTNVSSDKVASVRKQMIDTRIVFR